MKIAISAGIALVRETKRNTVKSQKRIDKRRTVPYNKYDILRMDVMET